MPRSLRKIQSQIKKKRGASSTALVEDSRDAQRLRRGMLRHEKLVRSEALRQKALLPKVTRYRHFQELATVEQFSVADILQYIESFLSRLDEEIKVFSGERRPGRPRSSQEDRLRNSLEKEMAEFHVGYEVPDLFDPETRRLMSGWKGDAQGLAQMRTIRITKEGKILPIA
ncbi:hypothetical protein TWF569_001217 [Orbilia oligospora]|uniref:Translation machinery-associated protein 16 n=1 Tax=Orbilia oligospora TaxID=2813651 RepID=A0A7C8IZI5_ORBOL|nr:hypothetical protein TWF706_002384 [Orbilia oligospora]KAF3081087.1 hypothetical protein TWF706_002384 [Orbilia oligospora]KAF3082447.1 hypothetical protein TWF103_003325 [Orbilia oligospora]KAF3082448.1 hypothetical protein TWF103_003325 [Orbilia oligospora]KAF3084219.1 hypothetical protein TWF102_000457 [Orbilia oligospora]